MKVQLSHVHIELVCGKDQAAVEVSMFDAVTAASIEVAFAASYTRGHTYTLCCGSQVNSLHWVAVVALAVKIGVGMAYQAIHIFRVGEIIRCVLLPAKANVA